MIGTKMEVGVIGAGAISTTLHLPLLSCMGNVSIKYIADVKDPKELANVYKIKSIKIDDVSSLPDCDLVVLATPVGVREKYVEEFSKRNVPIFSEKPFAINLDMHKKFLELSDKITCNYAKIYYNSTIQIKDIISSGIFGNLKKISISEGGIVGKTNRGKDTYQSDVNLSGGGIIMEASCHTLSQLASIFDDISVRDSNIVWENDYDVEANVNFDVFEKNSINVDYTITLIQPVEVGTTLFFDNCKLNYNHAIPDSELIITDYNTDKQFSINKETRYATTANQAYYLKWKSFLDKITSGVSIDTKSETSLKTTELITDIYQKADKK
jgi:predicted dehydrogenase